MLLQLLKGVTVEQSSSFNFQTAFVTTTAAALGISAAAVTITAVSPIATRRLNEDKSSRLRALSASTTVAISYYVSTTATRASTEASIANSGPTLANSLNAVGATNGFTASVGAVTFDFSTSYPTSDPAYSRRDRQCFAGTETVQLESGGIKAIADIVVGDRVLAASALGKASYSEVRLTILRISISF
jgi:Hint module